MQADANVRRRGFVVSGEEERELRPENLVRGQNIKVLALPIPKDADAKKVQKALYAPLKSFNKEQRSALRWIRAEVMDTDQDRVRVHFPKKPKKFDSWMRTERCRMINHITIDWPSFDDMLPIGQDHDSRQIRKDLFRRWNTEGKGYVLTFTEARDGVYRLVGRDIGEDMEELDVCVKLAFQSARNLSPQGSGKTVDQGEFHAFLVCLRWYLEVAEVFEKMDSRYDDNQMLSLRELIQGKDLIAAWGIDEATIRCDFESPDHDLWTPLLTFQDFAQWCVEKRWGQRELDLELDSDDEVVSMVHRRSNLSASDRNRGSTDADNQRKMVECFANYDSDGSGTISEEELFQVFQACDPPLPADRISRIFELADANRDGVVDYEEFCAWLFK